MYESVKRERERERGREGGGGGEVVTYGVNRSLTVSSSSKSRKAFSISSFESFSL